MNPFQPSVAFHMETSHLIFSADQVNGFYMKCSTELKWVNSPPSFFNVNLKIIRNVHSDEIISSKTSIKGFYMLKVSRHLFEYVWKYLWLVIINSKNEEPLIPISLFHSSDTLHWRCCKGSLPLRPFNVKGALSGLRRFLSIETLLKLMKNVFCFTLKALFVLKILNFLFWLFRHM